MYESIGWDCGNVSLPFVLQCKLFKDEKARIIQQRDELGRIASVTQVPLMF